MVPRQSPSKAWSETWSRVATAREAACLRHGTGAGVARSPLCCVFTTNVRCLHENVLSFLQCCAPVAYSSVSVPMSIILLLWGIQFDQGIYSHNRNTCFDSTLQLLDLAHTRLEDTHLDHIGQPAL
jgi:hypothetical protein